MKNQVISDRITVQEGENSTVIQISQQIEPWKRYALLGWLAAWLFCGVVFFIELTKRENPGEQMYLGVLLGVWLFIFYRILRVTIWRFIGKELITFSPGNVSIRNAFGNLGKRKDFNSQHIMAIKQVKNPKFTFFQFMENSFWVIGDNKFEFNYMKGTYQFGKQLSDKEIGSMKRILDKTFRKYKKN